MDEELNVKQVKSWMPTQIKHLKVYPDRVKAIETYKANETSVRLGESKKPTKGLHIRDKGERV